MSAIAASTVAVDTAERPGKAKAYPVAASTSIPAGVLVATDSSGNLVNASDAASIKVVGVSQESKDNSAGSAGDLTCTVKKGVFKFTNSDDNAITAAMVGKLAFVESNVAVANTSTNKIVAGRILEIDADLGVWVDTSDTPVHTVAALTSSQNATTAASDLATAQALANALKTSYNALQVDVAAIRTALLG
jgi:hypothetical protein